MFAIGASIKDPTIRYIKQIKVRTGEFKYGENHVELCKIEKSGSFLGFTHVGYSSEKEQLKPSKELVDKVIASRKGKKGSKRHINPRMFRSALATAQIDIVSQLADEAFKTFNKH